MSEPSKQQQQQQQQQQQHTSSPLYKVLEMYVYIVNLEKHAYKRKHSCTHLNTHKTHTNTLLRFSEKLKSSSSKSTVEIMYTFYT